ncbi:pseudouridine synthase [Gautieria morchelliformis]|nr:pseudouridine synthase [Gautieria morchelliformis]
MAGVIRSLKTDARNLVQYVDKGVIVISKPPGVISQARIHPSAKKNDPANLTRVLRLDSRPLSVHRLDKGTTGALLLARTPQVARDLSQQFQSRLIRKTYLALVRAGRETFKADKGEIAANLKIEDGRVSISNKGLNTLTGWELVASSRIAPLSLIRLTLHTGVKHQLRVHLACILKAPILGDRLYSHSNISDKIQNVVSVPNQRLFLHASHISFFRYRNIIPKRLDVGVTAPLPEDFVHVSTQLGLAPDAREIHGGVMVNGKRAPCDFSDCEGWLA